eukprot:1419980-Alexandrium_andersonii.AAC.1
MATPKEGVSSGPTRPRDSEQWRSGLRARAREAGPPVHAMQPHRTCVQLSLHMRTCFKRSRALICNPPSRNPGDPCPLAKESPDLGAPVWAVERIAL